MATLLDSFWVDSRQHSVANGSWKVGGYTLATDRQYRVVIDGNWTAWNALPTNGDTSAWLKYLSGGQPMYSAFDYEVHYASIYTGPLPAHVTSPGSIPLSLDGGGTSVHIESTVGPTSTKDPASMYEVVVTGQGHPLRAAVSDDDLNENNGKIWVGVYEEPSSRRPTVGYVGFAVGGGGAGAPIGLVTNPAATLTSSHAVWSGHVASHAYDENLPSYWQPVGGSTTSQRWLELAFSAVQTIERVVINFFDGGHMFLDYVIETWDGSAWSTRQTVTGNGSASPSWEPAAPITGVSKLRLRASRWNSSNAASYGPAIRDVVVIAA